MATRANAAASSDVNAPPVGLCGEFTYSATVRGVMAASSVASTSKPGSVRRSHSGICTGVAPREAMMPRTSGQNGAGNNTSSPGSSSVCITIEMPEVAPDTTHNASGSMTRPDRASAFARAAASSSGSPCTGE